MNVMIVDDEELLRHGIKAMIERMDLPFTVVGMASDGVQALELLADIEPHVILTDIRMPRVDGLELVKIVSTRFPKVKSVILSGYDDFDFAKRALKLGCIDYLVKPPSYSELRELLLLIYKEYTLEKIKLQEETEKNEIIKRNQLLIRTDFLRSIMVQKGFQHTMNIREQSRRIGLDMDSEHYVVNILKFEKQHELRQKYTLAEWQLLQYAAWNIAVETLEHHLCFYDEKSKLVMLFKEPLTVEECVEKCIAIRNNIAYYLNLSGSIAISPPTSLLSVGTGYTVARELLTLRLIREKPVIITEGDSATLINDNTQYHLDQLLELFKIDEPQTLGQKLENWIQSVKTSAYTPKAIEIISKELRIALIALYRSLSINATEPSAKALYADPTWHERIELADTLNEQLAPLLQLIERLEYKGQFGTLQNRTIEQSLKFIRKNFNSNLNLSSIAEEVKMTAAYFSVLFKRKTGKSVIEYLTEVRMEEAKKLLQRTDLKTYQVADQVGYSDAGYFSNIFKRYTGMSPQDYRNKSQL